MRTKDGVRLAGVTFGTGRRGAVLAHESEGSLCNWAPYARRLSAQGFEALAFDFRGAGLSAKPHYPKSLNLTADIAAAVRELRRRGATSVVLAGASMGATASVVAAASIKPAVSGVVALSGARTFVRLDAAAAARRLQVPALFVAEEADVDYPSEAQALFAATASKDKRVEVLPGGNHGTRMLASTAVADLVTSFVRDHSSP